MNWELLRTFEITLRSGSFAAAGRELGIEHTTVARRIAALEEDLGRPVFERSTQGLRPTEVGEALGAEVRRMAAAAEAASRAATQVGTELAGPVRLTTSPVLRSRVVSRLAPLLRAHPLVQLDLVEGVEYADLSRREADLALRMRPVGVPPAEDDTPVRRLGEVPFGVYVPAGWEGRTLHESPVVRYNEQAPGDLTAPIVGTLPAAPPLAAWASGILAVCELVREGIGWSVLPDLEPGGWPGATRVADAGLRFVVWLALQGSRRRHPAVRLVADELVRAWLSPPDGSPARPSTAPAC